MNPVPLTWEDWFASRPDVPRSSFHWWLSDRLDLPLTCLPLTEPVPETEQETLTHATERLAAGEPVQYVCGRAPFRNLTLRVTPDVLIPRPETEQLVQWALDAFLPGSGSVLDVGTGSGCIALALKQDRPDLQVEGTDISPKAVTVARGNAAQLRLDVRFRTADLLSSEPEASRDLIIANLPYVGEKERSQLPAEVRDWEPASALFGGPDGTDLIQALLLQAPSVLKPGGTVLLETGETHTAFLRDLARQKEWSLISASDLAGRERFHALQLRKA